MNDSPHLPRPSLLTLLGPGLLVAATGVGAGDLLTAGLAGSRHGLTLLWAAWIGATLKWFLNEGIARWQMATDTTTLEGWVDHLGRWIRWVFGGYLLIWTFFTGGAMVSACGVGATGLFPLSQDLRTSKILWGTIHSLIGAALVLLGGFKLFERLMAACVALMFLAVVATAVLIQPDWGAVTTGLLVPRIPPGGLGYLLGVLGGVGGTVTLLSYGYWIREKGRRGADGMRACRIDLGAGYTMTALFGVAMIIIGSRVSIQNGPTVALELAGQLAGVLGPTGKWVFLIGFWGAVFSSLLGVWQSVPYIFADFVFLHRNGGTATVPPDLSRTAPYRAYLAFIALGSLPLLWMSLERAQLSYAVMGSLFMPLLAFTLLLLNTRRDWVGALRYHWTTNTVLVATLVFFGYVAGRTAVANLGRLLG
ncbi:MAG TPA: Nramp family divalent metal transporter [Gemmatimonadales bacterium]